MSSGIRSTYAENTRSWNNAFMPDTIDLDSVRRRIERIMTEKGVKPTTLSEKMGNSKTLVSEILKKNGDTKLGTLIRLADALDVSVTDFLVDTAPILGASALT